MTTRGDELSVKSMLVPKKSSPHNGLVRKEIARVGRGRGEGGREGGE